MVIWKFPVQFVDEQFVKMPKDAQLLSAQVQGTQLCIWALCDETWATSNRRIRIHGTGHEIVGHPGRHLGTVQLDGGALIFHVFES